MSLPNPGGGGKPPGFLRVRDKGNKYKRGGENYDLVLALLAVAEAFMSNKSERAQEHFIAIVKELEERFGFVFERVPEEKTPEPMKRRFFCTSCKKEVPQHQVMPSLGREKLFHVCNCDAAPGSGIVNEVPEGWGEEPKEKAPETAKTCMTCWGPLNDATNFVCASCLKGGVNFDQRKLAALFCLGCCKYVPKEECIFNITNVQHVKSKSKNIMEICGAVEVRKL